MHETNAHGRDDLPLWWDALIAYRSDWLPISYTA